MFKAQTVNFKVLMKKRDFEMKQFLKWNFFKLILQFFKSVLNP